MSTQTNYGNDANACQTITVREAKRANVLYRPHGLRAMGEIAQARKDLNFMPDALKIIPDVVDEMVGDQDEDQMEIDSRNGRGSTQDDTLTACVQCLLQCFNPTANSGEGQSIYSPPTAKIPANAESALREPPSVMPC
jgi:proteasome component ECM29